MRFRDIQVQFFAWSIALAVLVLRLTCRIRLHRDPREQLRREGKPYIYAVMHAHQVSAILDAERGTGAMVSRSLDGQLIVPALKIRGAIPIRGSGGRGQRKGRGGLAALEALVDHVNGGRPAYLAVDGPRGPRGRVQRGIAALARRSDAAIICLAPIPSRRWVLRRAWDRFQIPQPLARIDGYFAEPIYVDPAETDQQLRTRVETALHELEKRHDPTEAEFLYETPAGSSESQSRAA